MTAPLGVRLDQALTARGLARSRSQAKHWLDEGRVLVNQRTVTKASSRIEPSDVVQVIGDDHYVSRAGTKLRGALDDTGLCPEGRALDAGASTGGFTQVLLEAGCDPVYAVDVGHGQLAPVVARDPRVRVRERLNLRSLDLSHLDGQQVDWIVADVSFISLTILLDRLLAVLRPTGSAMLLVKPQFEVGRQALGSTGVVRDPRLREQAVGNVASRAAELGYPPTWQGPSRVRGQDGNVEYFLALGGTRDNE